MILTGGHLPERGSGALRTPVGQAPGLSARSARGAAEARRSRGARSALAAATPQAPLTWEERPRTLRSAPEPDPQKQQMCLQQSSYMNFAYDDVPFGVAP